MEDTTTNYTINKTLMDYYNSNIDIHIDWLIFLNSFQSLSNKKGFLEIVPILESIREEAYTSFEYDIIPDDLEAINKQVIKLLEKLLEKHDMSEAIKMIGVNLKIEDIINLSTTHFMRKEINELQKIIISQEDTIENKFISTCLDKMCIEKPYCSLSANGHSSNLLSYYLNSIKIQHDDSKTLQNYIYNILTQINGINMIMKRTTQDNISNNDINFLLSELGEFLYLKSSFSLASVFEDVKEYIKTITITEDMTLKKHI